MPCYHPLKGYRAKTVNPTTGKRSIVFAPSQGFKDLELSVPCGQCIGCKLERSRQWAIRCVHEASLHEDNMFLTLTYKPMRLPDHGTLVKKHFQDFMKRYRKWLGGKKIRFFHCGEYGEKSNRPHYHALIFGHTFTDKQHHATINGNRLYTSKKLDRLWTHGHCLIGNVTFESAAYVARYVTKKITGPNAEDHYGIIINYETGEYSPRRIPEYVTMSRRPGIGSGWFNKYTSDVFPLDEVILKGKKLKPPKYYNTLYELLEPEKFAQIKAARIAAGKKSEHNTYERLRVRETIQLTKFNSLKRNFEK